MSPIQQDLKKGVLNILLMIFNSYQKTEILLKP